MNIFLAAFSAILLLFTVLSLIRHDYWTFRVFDYPRLQKLTLSVICGALLLVYFDSNSMLSWIPTLLIMANIVYLSTQIITFTPLGKIQVPGSKKNLEGQSICVMIANVYQDNKNTKGCLDEIYKNKPDVVLLLETDSFWEKETRELEKDFPYYVRVPLPNTYGMLLYSRLELNNPEVKYMVEEDVPSIHTGVILESGAVIRLYAVHPTPPVPNENPRATERDKELLLIAELAKKSKEPVIVIGDLNDVAWSFTTELFLKMSGLMDPRRGRGFFNSFHAHYPFLRFPLDHAFISEHFKLKKMKRLSNFDSDHFPIFIHVQHEPRTDDAENILQPDAEDVQLAEEKKTADTHS